ncbi:MAG: DNA alkylation repair protein [Paludibacteraceae bacterium]|nr:DNA alkylation repair protein [Paludibacteraceae bacterium]
MDEFFMYDEKMEQRVDQLKRMLRLSMNGVVSGCMSASGLDYKLNYGVQLPRLKEMAAGMDKDKMFAQRLWMSNCREMMLLATMLFPMDSFDEETALKWVSECHNMELVEQLSLNLLRNMEYADDLIIKLLEKQGKYEKATAYVLASFLYLRGSLSVETEEACKSAMENDASSSDYAVYSSVARFLRVLSGNERTFVAQFMDRLDGKSEKGPSFVRENVRMMLVD